MFSYDNSEFLQAHSAGRSGNRGNRRITVGGEAVVNKICDVIIENCVGMYRVNLANDTFKVLKAFPYLPEKEDDEGCYTALCCSLLFQDVRLGQNTLEAYQHFIVRGLLEGGCFTRRFMLKRDSRALFFSFLFLPEADHQSGYLLLFPYNAGVCEDLIEIVGIRPENADLLYSMIVDLDHDQCRNIYVAELPLSGQNSFSLSFLEWRTTIVSAIETAKEKDDFLKRTNPKSIRRRLAGEGKKLEFDIRRTDLSGEYKDMRHSIKRVAGYLNTNYLIQYSVRLIEKEPVRKEPAEKEAAGDSAVPVPPVPEDISQNASNRPGNILDQIALEIRENYSKRLTLKALSAKYFINTAYLGQLFIERFGLTFNEYLWEVRLKRAAWLLTHTDHFIYEIIAEVGCTNSSYFNKMFAEKYKMSPSAYRHSYQV